MGISCQRLSAIFVSYSLREIFKIRRRYFTSNGYSLCSVAASKCSCHSRRLTNINVKLSKSLILDDAEMLLVSISAMYPVQSLL